ncbi:replication factor C subunit 1 [Clonorchis sinensis]|uniref:Replication factor C subunit 1 n=1 Tax=Clonorchis sinensis TaxID=79923 RepID=H2KQY2_CLOSI|nr:replication factor C subunit 1 [Clonorchis sinensis]
MRQAACNKENLQKDKKPTNTLEQYFVKKDTKTPVTPKRTEISVDAFFSSSTKKHKQEPKKSPTTSEPKKSPTTPPHTSPSIVPDTPIISPGNLIPDTPTLKSEEKPRQRVQHSRSSNAPTKATDVSVTSPSSTLQTSFDGVSDQPKPNTPASRRPFWSYSAREGPRALGSKPIPKGNPTCLRGKTFVITGILESIERDDARALIERCGGKVLKTLGKRTNYLVVGREPGEGKLAKAETLSLKQVDEDQLFRLIRELANEPEPNGAADDSEAHSPQVEKPKSPTKRSVKQSPYKASPKVTPVKKSRAKSTESPTVLTAKPLFVSSQSISDAQLTTTALQSTRSCSLPAPRPPSSELWVDKYKPTSLRTLIGQTGPSSPANRLYAWLSSWHQHFAAGTKAHAYSSAPPWASSSDDGKWARAALLSGPPGIGKTSSATIACAELGFSTCELNASDCRSKTSLSEVVSQSLGMQNLAQMAYGEASQLSTKQHVLLMDEVDGMAGNEDRGGMQELINMIKSTRIPIICMCNDRQSPKIRSLANYCYDLRFSRPRVEQIKAAVLSIACKENVTIQPSVLGDIIEASGHDIRQVINNTQMWSISGLADQAQLTSDASGAQKDIRLGAFDVIRKVFQPDISGPNGGLASINDSLDLFFQDYNLVPLFVQENYLNVRPRKTDLKPNQLLTLLAQASTDIAFGDIISSSIRNAGAGSWSLLPVQGIFSVVRPGRILRGSLPGGGPGGGISFPSWFGKNSNQGRMYRVTTELSRHMRLATHGASSNPRSFILDYASVLADLLTRPLKEGDVDSVLNMLVKYQLLREDLDSILELTTWSSRPNRMLNIDSKVKAALTRSFNKSTHLLPYATGVVSKGRAKRAGPAETSASDGEGEADTEGLFDATENNEEDDVQTDSMIIKKKHPSSSKPQSKESVPKKKTKTESATTSKSTRGRGGGRSR